MPHGGDRQTCSCSTAANQAFKGLSSFSDRFNLPPVHIDPWWSLSITSNGLEGLPDGVGHDEPLIQRVDGLE